VWRDPDLSDPERGLLEQAARATPEEVLSFVSALQYVAQRGTDGTPEASEAFSQYVRKAFGGSPSVACILGKLAHPGWRACAGVRRVG
jgi:hypothetical protein